MKNNKINLKLKFMNLNNGVYALFDEKEEEIVFYALNKKLGFKPTGSFMIVNSEEVPIANNDKLMFYMKNNVIIEHNKKLWHPYLYLTEHDKVFFEKHKSLYTTMEHPNHPVSEKEIKECLPF